MANADEALRAEIEKVRDRARLQALAQGQPPGEADRSGQQAVEEFCAKWGIRPEMMAAPRTARPAPAQVRTVDLGSSPLRTSANPSSTQAIRIADLLKKGRETAAGAPGAAAPPASPRAPAAPAAPAGKPSLSGLLHRVRGQSFPEAAPSPAARQASTTGSPPAARPPTGESSGSYSLPVPPSAERRRALLEQFDRTYSEVQAMLEERIGVADVAMSDAPRGLASAFERAASAGMGSEEARVLASDVQRLRDHLRQMTSICDEFLDHLDEFVGRASGKDRP